MVFYETCSQEQMNIFLFMWWKQTKTSTSVEVVAASFCFNVELLCRIADWYWIFTCIAVIWKQNVCCISYVSSFSSFFSIIFMLTVNLSYRTDYQNLRAWVVIGSISIFPPCWCRFKFCHLCWIFIVIAVRDAYCRSVILPCIVQALCLKLSTTGAFISKTVCDVSPPSVRTRPSLNSP